LESIGFRTKYVNENGGKSQWITNQRLQSTFVSQMSQAVTTGMICPETDREKCLRIAESNVQKIKRMEEKTKA